ncbi:Helicase associated domain protein [Marisediminicola antarctica]|nr:CPBP family glutamic-type intramembrane protease [Marisediminicola antarctica]
MANYEELRSFRATKGKLPLEAGVGSEATLGGWLRNQRRRHKRGRMPAWQADLLQRIPGFVWEPAVGAWWVKLELLRAFLEREGRVPRYRAVHAGERELAAWVHKQRHFLCVVAFLPAVMGWHVLIPALGGALLLVANLVHRPWRQIFVPHTSPFVVASIVMVSVGVAAFQLLTSAPRQSSGSLEWSVLPGQEYGPLAVIAIVIVASITNATFEELLWRVGLQRLFAGRGWLIAQWLLLSVIFGLSHVNGTPGGILGMAFAGLFGFVMCIIREVSRGSVIWIIVVHFVADVILIGGVYGIFIW